MMAGLPRPGMPTKRDSTMRPPMARPANPRARSATPALLNGRTSPAESVSSSASKTRSPGSIIGGVKRKAQDFERDGGQETNINVVVRCRGRNDREVRENSGVVVATDGTKGNTVELSMGPSALSNKTYAFDKVFSPAADQGMVFDEVVVPIMEEVLQGFNCTIFAYGQTGTGKTYTMSGDITDMLPLPDAAGIIPRVLHYLFTKLDGEEFEHSVKCSFIELYNEELRDLLSVDDTVKLKIYEESNKKGSNATLVQGMEESHIKTASKGIQLLREGSHKRQVAATKCNDLSSRSHTVFTITVYMKRTSETGEDFVSAGKLNLVDLAGSENIQRSGAENKRAAEAGLINKSLLTLGRVINALVEKGSHIPYRESKLTRLLQDSLGGRTKTCIIATLSPAKSNLEETISTLDYAFRAKNIRNKPQVNQMVSKKTLLKEFTAEIEKLKSELIATRQRNGVYLTAESYEEITTESESRRILSEEQRDKIETMEVNLRNKVQELFVLTTSFNSLKKDNEATKLVLEGTQSILEKTEAVLLHTRQKLAEEAVLRKAHEKTEESLAATGQALLSTLGRTTSDISGLHSKLRRRSDLHSTVRDQWTSVQDQVSNDTQLVDQRLESFSSEQGQLVSALSTRMQTFVEEELEKLNASKLLLREKMKAYRTSENEVNQQTTKSNVEMNEVLEEIRTLREDVKDRVSVSLDSMSGAAQRISAGIVTELDAFQTQLHSSYATLGREFKGTFDELVKQLTEQQTEAQQLRSQLAQASSELLNANIRNQTLLGDALAEEKSRAAEDRKNLLSQMTLLVNATADAQDQRMATTASAFDQAIEEANSTFSTAQTQYSQGMDGWSEKARETVSSVGRSRDSVKTKIKADFATANNHTTNLRTTATSVHESTLGIVAEQKKNLDMQLHSLDDIVARVRAQNDSHHATHTASLASLASTVDASYSNIGEHFTESFSHVENLREDMDNRTKAMTELLEHLAEGSEVRGKLRELNTSVQDQAISEYAPTGQTPQRIQYSYPTTLPRTESHDVLVSHLRDRGASSLDLDQGPPQSPTKGQIFTDTTDPSDAVAVLPSKHSTTPRSRPASSTSNAGLRELDINAFDGNTAIGRNDNSMPPPKRQNTNGLDKSVGLDSKLPMKKGRMTVAGIGVVADRENMSAADFSRSVGAGGLRRPGLRSQGST